MCLYCDFDGKSKAYAIKYNKPENIFLILVNVKLTFSLDFIDENYGFVLTKTNLNLYGAQKQLKECISRMDKQCFGYLNKRGWHFVGDSK